MPRLGASPAAFRPACRSQSHLPLFPRVWPNHPVKPIGGDEQGFSVRAAMCVARSRCLKARQIRVIETWKDKSIIGSQVSGEEQYDTCRNNPVGACVCHIMVRRGVAECAEATRLAYPRGTRV